MSVATDTQLSILLAVAEALQDLAEKTKIAAQEADGLDCDTWACGGSHSHPPGGQGHKVLILKAKAANQAAAAENARQAYEQLKAQAS